jgi:prepilin-type N-terminal cleavage/methylation domain-containing protein
MSHPTPTTTHTPNRGFSLPEVLASISLLTIFIAIALQAMVSSVALQAVTAKSNQADNWIQADLDSVRFTASRLPTDRVRCSNISAGYAQALEAALGTETNRSNFTANGISYTLSRTLSTSTDSHVLVLQYMVAPSSGEGPALATRRVEVMPNAALNCP